MASCLPPALHAVLPLPGRALNHGHFILIKSRRTYVSREAGWKRVQDGRNLTRGREEQGYSSPETDGLQRVGEAAGKGASILLLETAWPRSHLLSSPLAPESSARERPRKLCGARAISAALLPPGRGGASSMKADVAPKSPQNLSMWETPQARFPGGASPPSFAGGSGPRLTRC